MQSVRVTMFGRLQILNDMLPISGLEAHKVRHLLCYLLVHRDQVHSRERLASLLWQDKDAAQSKRNLRQIVYQLQSAFTKSTECANTRAMPFLLVEPDWIGMNPDWNIWLDVAEFEDRIQSLQSVPVAEFTTDHIEELQGAVSLYQGDFLEGWYEDWCIFERERLQRHHLFALDKLLAYYEMTQDFEMGMACGLELLRFERAHERTHRRLMKMAYRAGDRTSALRQYDMCVAALAEELDVPPAPTTTALYKKICRGDLEAPAKAEVTTSHRYLAVTPDMVGKEKNTQNAIEDLRNIRGVLIALQRQVETCVTVFETTLERRKN